MNVTLVNIEATTFIIMNQLSSKFMIYCTFVVCNVNREHLVEVSTTSTSLLTSVNIIMFKVNYDLAENFKLVRVKNVCIPSWKEIALFTIMRVRPFPSSLPHICSRVWHKSNQTWYCLCTKTETSNWEWFNTMIDLMRRN